MTELKFDPTKHTLLFGDSALVSSEASDYWLWSDLLDWESDVTKSHHWESVSRFPKGDPQGRGGQFAPGGSGSVSTEDDGYEASSTSDSRWWNSIPWVRQLTRSLGHLKPQKVDLPDYINFKFRNKEAQRRFEETFPDVSLGDVGRLVEGIDKEGISATGFVAPWQKDRLSFEWSFWRGEGRKRYLVGQMAFWTGTTGTGRTFAELTFAAMEHNETRSGLGRAVMGRLMPLLKNMGIRHVRMRADITIGKYAWAKMGFEYVSPTLAERANQRFAEWAKIQYLDEPADGWPKFSKPIEWAKYSIPGITLTGNDINNIDVKGDHAMHVGKAFMLDGRGHGDWLASLDLNKLDDFRMLFKSFPYKFRAKPFMEDEEPEQAEEFTYMFGLRGDNIPEDASDLIYWMDWLISDETSSPIKAERDISHVLRDRHGRWIDTPGVGDDFADVANSTREEEAAALEAELDALAVEVEAEEAIVQSVMQEETAALEAELDALESDRWSDVDTRGFSSEFSTVEGGRENAFIRWQIDEQFHSKEHPRLDRDLGIEDYGLTKNDVVDMVRSWDVDEKHDLKMIVSWDDGLHFDAHVTEKREVEAINAIGEDRFSKEIGKFNFDIIEPELLTDDDPVSDIMERTVVLDYGIIRADAQGKKMGTSMLQNTLMKLAGFGVKKATLTADVTIGRYAWAKRGFDYTPDFTSTDRLVDRLETWLFDRQNILRTSMDKWVKEQDNQYEDDDYDNHWQELRESVTDIAWEINTAYDMATFELPKELGVEFTGADISNSDVPASMKLHAGKAFMLDQSSFGHGEWKGEMYLGWLAGKSQSWLLNIENRSSDGMTVKQAELPVVREGEPLEDWLQRSVPAITQQVGMSEQEAADVASEAWGIVNPESAAQESFDTGALPPEAAPTPNGEESPEWEDDDTWGEDFGEEGLESSPAGENVDEFGEEESFGEAPSDEDFFAAGEASPEPSPAEAGLAAPEPTAESDDDFWNRFFQSGAEEAPAEGPPPEEEEAAPVAEDEFEEEPASEEEPIEEEEEEEAIGTAAAAAEEEAPSGEEELSEEDELEALADAEAEEEDFEEEDDLDAELEDEEDLDLEDEEDLDLEDDEEEEELEKEFA